MRIALGADHAGIHLKAEIRKLLDERGIATPTSDGTTDSVDYPDFADRVAHAVASGEFDRGLLFCGSASAWPSRPTRCRNQAAPVVDETSARSAANTTTRTCSRLASA
jgi:ribose 5-phosphate isomerase B